MDNFQFNRLNVHQKLELLQHEGEYIAARDTPTHFVYLFTFQKKYVEVWMIKGLHQIQWIEIQTNKQILSEYVEKVDWKKSLGI